MLGHLCIIVIFKAVKEIDISELVVDKDNAFAKYFQRVNVISVTITRWTHSSPIRLLESNFGKQQRNQAMLVHYDLLYMLNRNILSQLVGVSSR